MYSLYLYIFLLISERPFEAPDDPFGDACRRTMHSLYFCIFSNIFQRDLLKHLMIRLVMLAVGPCILFICLFSFLFQRDLLKHLMIRLVMLAVGPCILFICLFSFLFQRDLLKHLMIHLVMLALDPCILYVCIFSRLFQRDLLKHLMIRLVMLAVVPLGLYISMFYVHLSILKKAGPHACRRTMHSLYLFIFLLFSERPFEAPDDPFGDACGGTVGTLYLHVLCPPQHSQ